MKFVGDAIITVWPVNHKRTLMDCAVHAAHCALKMQEAKGSKSYEDLAVKVHSPSSRHILPFISNFPPCLSILYHSSYLTHLLIVFSHQIGLGVGNLTEFIVGGTRGRWEYLLAGSPLTQAFHAQSAASRGHVMISPEMCLLLLDSP